jgi:hypothetical protein
MRKRGFGLLAVLVVVAVGAPGCGGSGDDASTQANDGVATAEASLSKDQFIQRGDAICKIGGIEVERDVAAFAKEHNIDLSKEPSKAQLKELADEVVMPGIKAQLKGLRELGEPSEAATEADEVLDALEAGVEKGEENANAFLSGETLEEADKEAVKFGFKVCGGGE